MHTEKVEKNEESEIREAVKSKNYIRDGTHRW